MGGPADASRPQAHLLCPQALSYAKIDCGSGITGFRLDGRKPKDGLQHVGTPLGVVEHAAILNGTKQAKAEFGFGNTEFGFAPLFHAGFQCIWNLRQHFANGVVCYHATYLFRHLGYLARRAPLLIFDRRKVTQRRDDG